MKAPPVVAVECPECHEVLPVPLKMELVEGDLRIDADLTDVWAHAWVHDAG